MALVFGSAEAQAVREKDRFLQEQAALEERAEAAGRFWIVRTKAMNQYEYRIKAASKEDVYAMWDCGMFDEEGVNKAFLDEQGEEIISIREVSA